MIAAGSLAHVERVNDAADLPDAQARAMAVICNERLQAQLDLRIAVSDSL